VFSIAALFTGGLLPGVVLALLALVWWRCRDEGLSHVRKATGSEIVRSLVMPSRHGHRTVRAAVRSRLLCRLRHRPCGTPPRAFAPSGAICLALLVGLIVVAIFPWISIGLLYAAQKGRNDR